MRRLPAAIALGFLALTASCQTGEPTTFNRIELGTPTPGKQTIDSVRAGDKQVTVYFKTGGANSYAAICRTPTSMSSVSGGQPIIVTGLTNDTEYYCLLWGFNGNKVSPPSDSVKATPRAP